MDRPCLGGVCTWLVGVENTRLGGVEWLLSVAAIGGLFLSIDARLGGGGIIVFCVTCLGLELSGTI